MYEIKLKGIIRIHKADLSQVLAIMDQWGNDERNYFYDSIIEGIYPPSEGEAGDGDIVNNLNLFRKITDEFPQVSREEIDISVNIYIETAEEWEDYEREGLNVFEDLAKSLHPVLIYLEEDAIYGDTSQIRYIRWTRKSVKQSGEFEWERKIESQLYR